MFLENLNEMYQKFDQTFDLVEELSTINNEKNNVMLSMYEEDIETFETETRQLLDKILALEIKMRNIELLDEKYFDKEEIQAGIEFVKSKLYFITEQLMENYEYFDDVYAADDNNNVYEDNYELLTC
jgi:hypothetical protein